MNSLRERRVKLGVPQGTLASLARVNRPTLSEAELGKVPLTPEAERRVEHVLLSLEEIAAAYPVPLDFRFVPAVRALLERRGNLQGLSASAG